MFRGILWYLYKHLLSKCLIKVIFIENISFLLFLGQSDLLAGHGQGGGSVKVSLPISQSALTPGNQFVVQTPQGPKTIRIVSTTAPTQTVSSATGSQTRSASPATSTAVSGEGIKVSGGMLVVDGQVTGIPVSGKTRIIYKGWY